MENISRAPALSFHSRTTKYTRVYFGESCWGREGRTIKYARTTEVPEFDGGRSYVIPEPHCRVEITKEAREGDLPHLLTIAVGGQIRHWLAEGAEIRKTISVGNDSHFPDAVYSFWAKNGICHIFREDSNILLAKVYPDRSNFGPTAFQRFSSRMDLIVDLR